METKTSTKLPFKEELIDLIKKELPLHSVYVISVHKEKRKQEIFLLPNCTSPQKTVTYTLLVIGQKSPLKGLGDFMDDLYNKMQRRCRVYVIFYTLSKVKKRLNYGDNFLSQVIFKTNCIYKENSSLDQFSECSLFINQRAYESIQEIWKVRMDRAEYLLSSIMDIQPKEDSCSMLATMHLALEQICMGLLYVFWEFKPQYYALPYLFQLCSNFTQLPQTMFPKETYGSHRRYYMLCNAQHIIRFKTKEELSYRDSDKALNRCQWFFDRAKSLGNKQLEKLKGIHC
jgi:hypothetical protein